MGKLPRGLAGSWEALIQRSDSKVVLSLEVEEEHEGSFSGEEDGRKEREEASGSLGKSPLSIFSHRGGRGGLPLLSLLSLSVLSGVGSE